MQNKKIWMLVPKTANEVCGVTDYSRSLGARLNVLGGHEVIYITRGHCESPHFSSIQYDVKAFDFIANLEDQVLMIQLSLYGYEKRGVPIWLMLAVARLKKQKPKVKLVVMYHELWVENAKPWRSSYWLKELQKRVIKKMARLADFCITNLNRYEIELGKWVPQQKIIKLCVFSSMGEMAQVGDVNERKNILFLYQPELYWAGELNLFWQRVKEVKSILGIDRIVIAGKKLEQPPEDLIVEETGYLAMEDMSALLSQSKYYWVGYFNGYLGKSSVFAAAAAHGLVAICDQEMSSESDGLTSGSEYVLVGELVKIQRELKINEYARKINQWYCEHSIEKTAEVYNRIIKLS